MRKFQSIQGANLQSSPSDQIRVGCLLHVNRRIGALMKSGREQVGMEVNAFAKRFGISSTEIQRWESGFGTLQASLFAEIAPHFSQDIQWKFQLLINEIQRESKTLRGLPESIRELVENFDALGVASAIRVAA